MMMKTWSRCGMPLCESPLSWATTIPANVTVNKARTADFLIMQRPSFSVGILSKFKSIEKRRGVVSNQRILEGACRSVKANRFSWGVFVGLWNPFPVGQGSRIQSGAFTIPLALVGVPLAVGHR